MEMFNKCSGDCKDCVINYCGGCIAGHGDDDFSQVTKESAIMLVNRYHLDVNAIKYLEENYINNKK